MAKTLIPPVEDFRQHIIVVLLCMLAYDSARQYGIVPELGIDAIIPNDKVKAFLQRMLKANPTKNIHISEEEMLLTYACYDCSSKLLVSHHDETIMNVILDNYPDVKAVANLGVMRKTIVRANEYLLKDTDKKFEGLGALKELKEKLKGVVVE